MKPEIITIADPQTGSRAEILVSLGFNCFRFTAMPGGRPVEVLYAPDDFTTGQPRPSKGGIPLMLPFPGRIPGTTFTWEGRQYQLEPGDALGNAIHGFAMWRPWRVVEHSASHAVGEFHAWRDDPSLKNRWPADFRIAAEYRLEGNALVAEYTVDNPDDVPLPCGFGTHPYFQVPLGGESADECVVSLPVSAQWELDQMLPTGRRLPLENAAAVWAGRRYGDLKLDNAFSGLSFTAPWCEASLHDPDSGVTVTQRFDEVFRECVVFTPPHRQAICIEPLTCVPGCFELTSRGIDAGLKILAPGERFAARVEIMVTP
jgi:aldose 1-epimerase